MLKTSFHSANFPEIELLDLIHVVNEAGYDAIEINAATLPYAEPHVKSDIHDEVIEEIVATLKKNDLNISALCAHINLVDPRQKEESIRYTKRCIDIAVKLGTDIVQGSSGIITEDITEETAWETLTENLNEILAYAEKNNVKFTFEPVVVMFVNDGNKFKEINNRIKYRLYMNFDPSQLVIVNDNISKSIQDFADYIVHVHIKDAKGTPRNFEFPPLGQGVVDFNKVVRELENINFNGYYSIEYEAHVFGYQKRKEDVFDNSLQFLKTL